MINDKEKFDISPNNDREVSFEISGDEKFGNDSKHHHHSHHHSRRHHSRRHHSKRRKNENGVKSKIKGFFRKYSKKLINIAIVLVFVLALFAVALLGDSRIFDIIGGNKNNSSSVSDYVNDTQNAIQIELPLYTEDVELVHPVVTEYMSGGDFTAQELYQKYHQQGRIDVGLPVKLSYKINGIPKGESVQSSKFEVAENTSFANARVFELEGGKRTVNVYHLKTGTTYYYRITLNLSSQQTMSATGSFKTANTPRILSIDGIFNVRDIGGLKTADGRTVRQGLLYRGTEMDGAVEIGYSISNQGTNDMLTVLGIKTDLDLRAESDNPGAASALGASVKHIYFGAPMYNGIFESDRKESVRKVFAELAKKENYPVYLHCTYGADRTGTICYLLEAVLGVSKADLKKEYELSAFGSHIGVEEYAEFSAQISVLPGNTLRDKVEGYLLSIGVTPDEITSIRQIYLG